MVERIGRRSLTPEQARAIVAELENGVRAGDLARSYGVTKRTIYRQVYYAQWPIVAIAVGPWRASFALTPTGPRRLTDWRRARIAYEEQLP